MAKQKYDLVIEAARYGADGNLKTARLFERNGATFSDWKLVSREELMTLLKKGKKAVAGKRIANLGNTFETGQSISLTGEPGREVLATGKSSPAAHDQLDGVPYY